MIVHILRFSFKDKATDKDKAEALAAMSRIGKLDAVSWSVIGQDLGDPAEGYTHAYGVGIEDLAAFERYMFDPFTIESDSLILPPLEKLGIVDFSDDMDSRLSEKMKDLLLRKITENPEWAQLVRAIPDIQLPSDV